MSDTASCKPSSRKTYGRPLDIKNGHVDMAHGAGGRAMAQLIDELFARYLGNEYLAQGDDGASLPLPYLCPGLVPAGWSWRPMRMSSRRCSFPVATSVVWRCMARSTTWR
jgi:hypothetical protein